MTTVTRYSVTLAVVVGLLMIPAAYGVTAAGIHRKDLAAAWAEGLDPSARAEALMGISSYPFEYRKELLRSLSLEERVVFFRGYLQKFLDGHPEFSVDQRKVFAKISDLIGERSKVSVGDVARLNDLKTRIQELVSETASFLDRDTVKAVLFKYGPPDTSSTVRSPSEPLAFRILSSLRSAYVLMAGAPGDPEDCWGNTCNCSQGGSTGWDCPFDQVYDCRDSVIPYALCDDTWFGCGPGGFFSCDGCCWPESGQPN